jgi:hypothetical protein
MTPAGYMSAREKDISNCVIGDFASNDTPMLCLTSNAVHKKSTLVFPKMFPPQHLQILRLLLNMMPLKLYTSQCDDLQPRRKYGRNQYDKIKTKFLNAESPAVVEKPGARPWARLISETP